MLARSFALLVFVVGVSGCPASEKPSPSDAGLPAPCVKVGQSCEYSPGKLGTCVQKDECPSAAACFVCQSQH